MPNDGSNIPLGIHTPKPLNPIETLQSLSVIQNNMNQNRLFGQTFEARKAMGPILQQSVQTDPNSPDYGDIDPQKAGALLSADPRTAFMANDAIKSMLDRRKLQLDIQKERMEMALKQVTSVNDALGSLTLLGDSVTQKDVIEAVGRLVAQGVIDSKKAASALVLLPAGGPALAQAILQKQLQTAGAAKQLELKYGQIQQVNLGDRSTVIAASPMTGVKELAVGQHGMAPADAAKPVTGPIGAGGEETTMPMGRYAEQTGVAAPGRYTAPVQLGIPASGPMQTTLPVAQKTGLEKLGTDAADDVKMLNERVTVGLDLLPRIQEMRNLLSEIRTGGGSELRFVLAKTAQAFGASDALVDKISGGDTGSAEEFRKFALQSSVELLRQMLVGSRMTNLEFDQFRQNNPNLDTDPRGVEKIYNFTTRIVKRDMDKQEEFDRFKKTGGKIEEWPAHWTREAKKRNLAPMAETQGVAKSTQERGTPGGKKRSLEEIFGPK